MYVCLDCGNTFEEPDSYYETHGLETPPYEEISICPFCKVGDYVETRRCDCCGEWITGNYIKLAYDDKYYCEDCYEPGNVEDAEFYY